MDGRCGQPGSGRAGRAERLAAALRENLRRRKAQARARRGGEAVAETPRDDRPEDGEKTGGNETGKTG